MNIYKSLISLLSITFLLSASSCKKEEGTGGKASIHGMVVGKKRITSPILPPFYTPGTWHDYVAAFEDVYIIYGNEFAYGDKVETNGEGKFEFKYLRPGNYKIYAYSKDSTGNVDVPKFAIIKEVKISDKKEAVDAGSIQIFTYQ
ncbi:MAG: hypothetical protein K0Q95_119 [Bacteroidota bacterium]|jgi:hypothetical protein|nr:hypothetical protein [Bacteroidota bacterium]